MNKKWLLIGGVALVVWLFWSHRISLAAGA